MQIAIVGAGNVGGTLGPAWVSNPADPKYAGLGAGNLAVPAEAVRDAEALVLATPWNATEAAVRGLGNLAGRIVLDCTNPLTMGPEGLGLALGHTISGGEMVAGWAAGAAVFKTLNQTGAENMAKAHNFASPPVMFVAGDDAAKKPVVLGLVGDLGFEAVDAGPLRIARLLEPYGMLWID